MSATTLEALPRPARGRILRGLPWVVWRQHRLALAGTMLVLGGLGVFLVVSGLAMHHAYHHLGLAACGDFISHACDVQLNLFQQDYQTLVRSLPPFLMLLPVLLGVFVGAPVVARELESGTYRFAWTQGRSRVRWIVAKLIILATVLTVLALGFSLLFSWWYGPWASLTGRLSPSGAYEVAGIVFAARTLFAFMLGALLGTIIRRTVPAMAATAVVGLAVVLPSMHWLRPLIEKPVAFVTAISTTGRTSLTLEFANGGDSVSLGTNAPHTAWEIAHWTQDPAGHHLTSSQILSLFQQANFNPNPPLGAPARAPVGSGGPVDNLTNWLAQHGYRLGVSYQPASRFWHFQGVEAGAYVLLALLCAAATVWWIRRRTA